jgi:putative peptidoglycan lipid II flippase
MLPIAALGMALRLQVVELLLGYGRFTEAAVDLTAGTLLVFLLGLAAHGSIGILARAFYARQDTRTPVIAAILAVVINTVMGALLVGPLGLPALGLAIATAAWVETAVLLVVLARREPGLDVAGILGLGLRSLIGAAVAGAVAAVVLGAIGPLGGPAPGKVFILGEAIVATLLGGLAYLAASLALRIPELGLIVGIVGDLARRRGR